MLSDQITFKLLGAVKTVNFILLPIGKIPNFVLKSFCLHLVVRKGSLIQEVTLLKRKRDLCLNETII